MEGGGYLHERTWYSHSLCLVLTTSSLDPYRTRNMNVQNLLKGDLSMNKLSFYSLIENKVLNKREKSFSRFSVELQSLYIITKYVFFYHSLWNQSQELNKRNEYLLSMSNTPISKKIKIVDSTCELNSVKIPGTTRP